MKKIQGIIVCLLAWAVSACTEDKGNYNYTRLNDLMIGGIEKVYTVEQSDRLAIPVEIKGTENFDSTRYDYVWYAWRINNSANPDTLSFEKNLNIEVKIAVGEYNLRYVVTDRETGIYYTTETDLNVINSYSKGIMALSSVNGNANVTFINALNRVTENAYEAINGKVAGTHPVGIYYTGAGEDIMATVIIATQEGSKVADPSDFSAMMDFSEFFYITPENQIMQCLCKSDWGYNEFVIVGGKIYSRR